MSVTELKKKILTTFENEIRVSFLLIVMYHVMNTCTNFKQKIAQSIFQNLDDPFAQPRFRALKANIVT